MTEKIKKRITKASSILITETYTATFIDDHCYFAYRHYPKMLGLIKDD